MNSRQPPAFARPTDRKLTTPYYELKPNLNRAQSFYGKAIVEEKGDTKTLYSYNVPVVTITGDRVTLHRKWDYSATTLRHVKEFLAQEGCFTGSKQEMKTHYGLSKHYEENR